MPENAGVHRTWFAADPCPGDGGGSLSDTFFDPIADVGVDVAPVVEGALQNRLTDAGSKVTNDVAHQTFPLGIVHHGADQGAGLAPVVVLGAQRVGGAMTSAISLRRRCVVRPLLSAFSRHECPVAGTSIGAGSQAACTAARRDENWAGCLGGRGSRPGDRPSRAARDVGCVAMTVISGPTAAELVSTVIVVLETAPREYAVVCGCVALAPAGGNWPR